MGWGWNGSEGADWVASIVVDQCICLVCLLSENDQVVMSTIGLVPATPDFLFIYHSRALKRRIVSTSALKQATSISSVKPTSIPPVHDEQEGSHATQITLGPSRTGVHCFCFITEATATMDGRTPRLPHLGSEAERRGSADYIIILCA